MATTWLKLNNYAYGTLNAGINNAVTTIVLASGQGSRFPSTYNFMIVVGDSTQGYEIMECTNRATDTLTVGRAKEGTGALPFDSATDVRLLITKLYITELQDAINNIETGTTGLDSLDVGGGYGDTGVTISAAGVIQANGAITTDGTLTANAAAIGGGYGDTGVTLSSAGAIQANASLTVDVGINVGTATGAGAGEIKASGDILTTAGNLASGVQGTAAGELILCGDNSGVSGKALFYLAENQDTNTDYFKIGFAIGEEDFAIRAVSGASGTENVILIDGTTRNTTISQDLVVDGGNIGITADTDLIQIAANELTVNGSIAGVTTLTTSAGITCGGGATFAANVGVAGRFRLHTFQNFTADDTTPDVSTGNCYTVPGTWTAGHDITMFDGGDESQLLIIKGGDADCDVVDGGNLKLVGGNWTATAGHLLVLLFDGTDWWEIARPNTT